MVGRLPEKIMLSHCNSNEPGATTTARILEYDNAKSKQFVNYYCGSPD